MKNLPLLLFGVLLFSLFVGCHYEEIPIDEPPVDPCDNPANPSCCVDPNNPNCCPSIDPCDPCDNPVNPNCCDDPANPNCCDDPPFPDCTTFKTFESTLSGSTDLSCSSPLIEEVIELPNDEGYVIVGFCQDMSAPNSPDRRAMLIHIDNMGNVKCSTQHTEAGDDFFKSIAIKNGNIVATGHTRANVGGSAMFNFKVGTNSTGYCIGDGTFLNDPSSNQSINSWDQGNSIVIDNDGSVVIAGKGSIYPSLFRVNSVDNLNTISEFENYTGTEFAGVAPNMIAVTGSNSCDVDHHVNKITQTGDMGFLFTGLINTDAAGQTLSKAYLAKTRGGNIDITTAEGFIKIFDTNESLGKNTVGRDIAEVAGGFKFILVGYGYEEDVPDQFLACGAPEFSGYDYNGFVVMVDAFGGAVDDKKFFDLSNGSRDFINGITPLQNNENEFVVVGSVERNGTEKLQVKHYEIVNDALQDGDITFNIESDSNKKTIGKDIISTSDGGFLIIANVRSGTGSAESIRIIKTDPDGNF